MSVVQLNPALQKKKKKRKKYHLNQMNQKKMKQNRWIQKKNQNKVTQRKNQTKMTNYMIMMKKWKRKNARKKMSRYLWKMIKIMSKIKIICQKKKQYFDF